MTESTEQEIEVKTGSLVIPSLGSSNFFDILYNQKGMDSKSRSIPCRFSKGNKVLSDLAGTEASFIVVEVKELSTRDIEKVEFSFVSKDNNETVTEKVSDLLQIELLQTIRQPRWIITAQLPCGTKIKISCKIEADSRMPHPFVILDESDCSEG